MLNINVCSVSYRGRFNIGYISTELEPSIIVAKILTFSLDLSDRRKKIPNYFFSNHLYIKVSLSRCFMIYQSLVASCLKF